MKVQEGSKRLKKVQGGSRMFKDSISFKKDHEGSRRFKEVQEGSRRFREVQEGSRRFNNVKNGSRWSMRTQKNFKKFSNVLLYQFFSWCFLSWECIPHVERSWITTFIIFLHETENCTNNFSRNLSNLKNKCMYLRILDNVIISRRV